jgi:transcriptional regulator with XRE-family HTH domain
MNHIGAKIREMRMAQGTTLPDLAKKADISKGLLFTIETDKSSNPSLSTLLKIAEALDTTVAELTGGTRAVMHPPPAAKPEWHKKLVSFLRSKGTEPDAVILDAMLGLQHRKGIRNDDLEYWKFVYQSIQTSIENSFKK